MYFQKALYLKIKMHEAFRNSVTLSLIGNVSIYFLLTLLYSLGPLFGTLQLYIYQRTNVNILYFLNFL